VFTTLNWSGNFGRLSRRYDVESRVTVCCFIKTMQDTPLPWQWLQFENAASNCSVHWLPRVPIFERFASWTELWLWWRGHPHDKWLVRTARRTVLCGRCKLASTSIGKMRCAWRGLYWKTVKGIWPFDHSHLRLWFSHYLLINPRMYTASSSMFAILLSSASYVCDMICRTTSLYDNILRFLSLVWHQL